MKIKTKNKFQNKKKTKLQAESLYKSKFVNKSMICYATDKFNHMSKP